MSGLRRLEVHCRSAAPLELPARGWPPAAPAGGGGLRWLCAGLHPLAAALALVRAHGRTLRELRLVAASDRPYGGASPDLTAALRPLCRRLRRLRRLVLVRESYSGNVSALPASPLLRGRQSARHG
ncbi:hypothetical protein ONE63_005132 [Megalurothrips usitatus]|uniref:Uncharacterized protein n=1 Tax=Megalurothrips usitatus TaxID=439358 RepID=A0AAV7XXW7_9NEOP|nr:hypothetical protein ONE63_005132 [Megalurothrips usitatus]